MYKAVLKPGSILSVGSGYNKKYIDQLSTDRLEIHYVSMKSYLKSKYKISLQDYYNIVKYNNINHTIKCKNPECTKSTKFINLSKGYTEYCCRSCQCSHKAKLQHLDINSKLNVSLKESNKLLSSKRSEFMKTLNNKNWISEEYRLKKSKLSYYTINSILGKSRSKYKNFISLGNINDTCIFYLGLTKSNDIKFGITGSNLDSGRCNRKWRLNLKSIHRVLISSRLNVAKLEFNIKMYYKSNSEYLPFSELHKVMNLVRNFKY